MLEPGSIDIPLTFDVGLIQLSFIPVCSPNTCIISVKLCRGFALQCFSFVIAVLDVDGVADKYPRKSTVHIMSSSWPSSKCSMTNAARAMLISLPFPGPAAALTQLIIIHVGVL